MPWVILRYLDISDEQHFQKEAELQLFDCARASHRGEWQQRSPFTGNSPRIDPNRLSTHVSTKEWFATP